MYDFMSKEVKINFSLFFVCFKNYIHLYQNSLHFIVFLLTNWYSFCLSICFEVARFLALAVLLGYRNAIRISLLIEMILFISVLTNSDKIPPSVQHFISTVH